jgi:hypothetical protein
MSSKMSSSLSGSKANRHICRRCYKGTNRFRFLSLKSFEPNVEARPVRHGAEPTMTIPTRRPEVWTMAIAMANAELKNEQTDRASRHVAPHAPRGSLDIFRVAFAIDSEASGANDQRKQVWLIGTRTPEILSLSINKRSTLHRRPEREREKGRRPPCFLSIQRPRRSIHRP